jgi:hypothetical protein
MWTVIESSAAILAFCLPSLRGSVLRYLGSGGRRKSGSRKISTEGVSGEEAGIRKEISR